MYVVADDEHHLGCFDTRGERAGSLIRLFAGDLPPKRKARKAAKPDLEVLTWLPPFAGYPAGALLALGSGSRPGRRTGAALALDATGAVSGPPRLIDLAGLYASLADRLPALNIEGGSIAGDEFFLLQRGNEGHPVNALIRLPLQALHDAIDRGDFTCAADALTLFAVDLGAVDGIPLCFTDCAALPDGRIVFTAVAEDTDDTYEDGACAGAAIGVLASDGRLLRLDPLEPTRKVEGVHARLAGAVIELLLVTDADDASVPGGLLSAELC